MQSCIRSAALVALTAMLLASAGLAQEADSSTTFIRTHYTKYEYRIPMRDGVRLFVSVYEPRPGEFKDHGPYPFLMTRTPYSCAPYGEDVLATGRFGVSEELARSGYNFVCADVRGRWQSEGEFREMSPHTSDRGAAPGDRSSNQDVDESTDTYDTIEYLLKHVPDNNGKVGIVGISYPGFYTSASIIDSHPAIKAASPQAPMTDIYMNDDSYHGGAFMLSGNYGFYVNFFPQRNPVLPTKGAEYQFPITDSYKFYLHAGPIGNLDTGKNYLDGKNWLYHDQTMHTTYDDYWQKRDLSRHMHGVKAAVMVVGGWFDAEDLSGPFKTFHAIDKLSSGATNSIVIGPWVHGGWARGDGDHLGDVEFGEKTGDYFRAEVQFPFFEHYLKDQAAEPLPKALVFETGSNAWRRYPAWPPPNAKAETLYFHAGGGLSFEAPTEESAVDSYVSDPAHPVPFTEYVTDTVPQRYMDDDQRFATKRDDVLVYETAPLAADVTLAGPIKPQLRVSSTGTDADFVVKLIDVYPEDLPSPPTEVQGKRVLGAPPVLLGGYEQLVRGEPMRAKFRDSFVTPTPLPVGKMVEVNSEMPDINHTFRAGHRMMVQVQSSWFPLVDRNPQRFGDIPHMQPEEFQKATESVYRQAGAASGVEVLVVPQR